MLGESSNLTINVDRLWQSIHVLAEIGPGVSGGCNRQTLTDEDAQVRSLFAQWCKEADMEVGIDKMGNMFALLPGTDPLAKPVYMGSHLDTQPTGGRYDGVLGVMSALEVVRTIKESGIKTKHPVGIINWTNEEGARFVPSMLGSGVFAGAYTLQQAHDLTDKDGLRLGDELARIGWLGDEEIGARPIHSFFEYHIEQGPVLEAMGKTVGVITRCQGFSWVEITLTGREAHTGSTPLNMRSDAALAFAKIVIFVNKLAADHQPNAIGSVAHAIFSPNSRNVLPGQVVFTVDVRSPDPDKLAMLHNEVEASARAICAELDVGISTSSVGRVEPVAFDPSLVDTLRRTARELNVSHMDLISGAGHDACWISHVAPTAMIMCPCVGGVSHNEAEDISKQWAQDGANVLLRSVIETACPAENKQPL